MKSLVAITMALVIGVNSYAATVENAEIESKRTQVLETLDKRIAKEEKRSKERNYDRLKKRAVKRLKRQLKKSDVENKEEIVTEFKKHLNESDNYLSLLKDTQDKVLKFDSEELEIFLLWAAIIGYIVYAGITVALALSSVTGISPLLTGLLVYYSGRALLFR